MKATIIISLITSLLLVPHLSLADYKLSDSSLEFYLPERSFKVKLPAKDYQWRHASSGHDDAKRIYYYSFVSSKKGLTVIATISKAECPDIETCHVAEREMVEYYRNDALENATHLGSVSDIKDSTHGEYLISRCKFLGYSDLVGATTLKDDHVISFIMITDHGNIPDPLTSFLDFVVIENAP